MSHGDEEGEITNIYLHKSLKSCSKFHLLDILSLKGREGRIRHRNYILQNLDKLSLFLWHLHFVWAEDDHSQQLQSNIVKKTHNKWEEQW